MSFVTNTIIEFDMKLEHCSLNKKKIKIKEGKKRKKRKSNAKK